MDINFFSNKDEELFDVMKEEDASMGFCASHAIHKSITSFNANYVGHGANQSIDFANGIYKVLVTM
jgi:hypothetical protein